MTIFRNLAMVQGKTMQCRFCGAIVKIAHPSQKNTCGAAACKRARHRAYVRKYNKRNKKKWDPKNAA